MWRVAEARTSRGWRGQLQRRRRSFRRRRSRRRSRRSRDDDCQASCQKAQKAEGAHKHSGQSTDDLPCNRMISITHGVAQVGVAAEPRVRRVLAPGMEAVTHGLPSCIDITIIADSIFDMLGWMTLAALRSPA